MSLRMKVLGIFGLLALGIMFSILLALPGGSTADAFSNPQWIKLIDGSAVKTPSIVALESDPSQMTGKFSLPGFELSQKTREGQSWDALGFGNRGYLQEEGAPDLPVYRRMFAVPGTSAVSIRVTKVDYEEYEGMWIEPLQHFLLETESEDDYPFAYNEAVYENDAFYPESWAEVNIQGVLHSVRLGQVEIHPFRFNPVAGILQVARTVEFTVEFSGYDATDAVEYATKVIPPHLVNSFKSLLVNYNQMNYQAAESDAGIDYLIIVDQDLFEADSLDDLADYHTSMGKSVSMVSTAATGTTSDSVKAYIQAEYDSITPPDLDYVLIVADVSVIPFRQNAFGSNDSDQWYGWLEGGDIFTDVGVGRFPAEDEEQLDNMVEKTLNFHNKVESGPWLNKSVLIAHKEQYPGKYTECKESIYNHTFSFDPPELDRIYGGDPATQPENDDIVAAIEDGRAVVNYRGHGDDDQWWNWSYSSAPFLTSHVHALANGMKTPIIYSIACLNLNMEASVSETFGEAWIRDDQGAVAFLGAIHPSYTYPNHDFDRSLYYAPWDNAITPIGDVLNWANVDMFNTYCGGVPGCIGEDNIAMFLWVGDPTVEIPLSGLLSPSDLSAEATSTSEIVLSWNDRADSEDGYKVEKDDGQDAWTEVATLDAGSTTWTDTGLDECGTYSYRVRAYAGAEYSYYSNTVTTQTLGSAPTNLAAHGTGIDEITLTWTDNTTGETGFSVFREDPVKKDFVLIHTTGANETTWADSGLAEGTSYSYKVATTTLGGDSAQNGPASAITLPAAAEDLVATANTDTSVTLDWTDISGGEDGYRIYRQLHSAGAWTEVGSVGAGVQTFDDATTTESTEFDYQVVAYNASGEGPASGSIVQLTVPAAASTFAAIPVSTSQIHLTWLDNSAGEEGFRLERNTGEKYEIAALIHADSESYSDTGHTEGALVTFRLYAFNDAGDSLPTIDIETMTMPNAPTDLAAQLGKSADITLTWTDNSATEEGYRIQRQIDNGDFEEVGTVGADVTTFEDPGVSAGVASYRVCAFNAYTDSEFSNLADTEPGVDDDDDAADDDDDATADDDDAVDDDDAAADTGDDDDDDDEGCGC